MKRNRLVQLTTLLLAISLSSLLAYAQTPGTKAAGSAQKSAGQTAKQEPCWQVAGISQEAMQQHKALEESTHSEIQSVCADSSLTPQQKREKIHQIHEQMRQKGESLITPQQQEALKSCREQRGEGKHMAGNKGMHHHGGDPCGHMKSGAGEKTPPPESSPKQ